MWNLNSTASTNKYISGIKCTCKQEAEFCLRKPVVLPNFLHKVINWTILQKKKKRFWLSLDPALIVSILQNSEARALYLAQQFDRKLLFILHLHFPSSSITSIYITCSKDFHMQLMYVCSQTVMQKSYLNLSTVTHESQNYMNRKLYKLYESQNYMKMFQNSVTCFHFVARNMYRL